MVAYLPVPTRRRERNVFDHLDPDHQLCCAHALRELQAVTDTAPTGHWCWATQAADALAAIQKLIADARAATADVDPAALAAQIQHYRCAAQIGANQNAARTDKLMKKHHALARRLLDRQDLTTCASPKTGEYRRTTTAPNATSG